MEFEEYDLRKVAKKNMEFITPIQLREWLGKKVHSKISHIGTVFDPAVGSGQLFQFIKSDKYAGCDINIKSLDCFKNNFNNVIAINDNYFNINFNDYDVAVSNYPFSLNNKDLFEEVPSELKSFFNKNITGKADFSFIIRSFFNAREYGFYLCFPGIAYRSQEQKFRDYLVNNNYVVSYGTLQNCDFDATNINLFYLELSKNKTDKNVEVFLKDFKDSQNDISKVIQIDSLLGETWWTPQLEKEEEEIDIVALEKEIEFMKIKRRETEDKLDDFIQKTFKNM